MNLSRLALLVFISVLIATFFVFDLQNYLTLETLKAQQAAIETYRSNHPGRAVAIYALIYIAVTGLSLRAQPFSRWPVALFSVCCGEH